MPARTASTRRSVITGQVRVEKQRPAGLGLDDLAHDMADRINKERRIVTALTVKWSKITVIGSSSDQPVPAVLAVRLPYLPGLLHDDEVRQDSGKTTGCLSDQAARRSLSVCAASVEPCWFKSTDSGSQHCLSPSRS